MLISPSSVMLRIIKFPVIKGKKEEFVCLPIPSHVICLDFCCILVKLVSGK